MKESIKIQLSIIGLAIGMVFLIVFYKRDGGNVLKNDKSIEETRLLKKIDSSNMVDLKLRTKQDSLKKEVVINKEKQKTVKSKYDVKIESIKFIDNNDSIVSEFKVIFSKNNIK